MGRLAPGGKGLVAEGCEVLISSGPVPSSPGTDPDRDAGRDHRAAPRRSTTALTRHQALTIRCLDRMERWPKRSKSPLANVPVSGGFAVPGLRGVRAGARH
ncbi:hypothetical protein GCM10010278_36840 [Streptomyces melanogenes]|nr:hypothetical protein GCM10010278_36840 [Streptomyces melanogenes]